MLKTPKNMLTSIFSVIIIIIIIFIFFVQVILPKRYCSSTGSAVMDSRKRQNKTKVQTNIPVLWIGILSR